MVHAEDPSTLVKKWLSENASILTVIAVFVLAKIPSLTMPFWWDEASVIGPSLTVAKNGLRVALPGGHTRGLLFGHPPVLYLLHASLYRLFGVSIFPHHVAAVPFAVIGLWFTYRLGSLLCGRSTGLCAAVLFAFSPMFFAQSTMVLGDMAITSLGVMAVYYLFAGQWLAYMIAATLLVQTKETALAIAVAAALYQFCFARKKTGGWRGFLMHAVPIGSLVVFFGIEYLATGAIAQTPWVSASPLLKFNLSDPGRGALVLLEAARRVTSVLFYAEGRFILTGILLVGILHWRKFWKPEFSLFGFVLGFYWATFSLIVFLPRYVMPALPYLCVAAAWSVYVVLRNRKTAQYAVVCIAALIFLPFFYWKSESGTFETNMGHKKAVAVCKRLSEYIEANFSGARIAADFPVSGYLRNPQFGYVKTPRQVIDTSDVNPDETLSADLFVYFSIGPSVQSIARLRAIGPPIRRFEEDGVFAELYDLGSPAGGENPLPARVLH